MIPRLVSQLRHTSLQGSTRPSVVRLLRCIATNDTVTAAELTATTKTTTRHNTTEAPTHLDGLLRGCALTRTEPRKQLSGLVLADARCAYSTQAPTEGSDEPVKSQSEAASIPRTEEGVSTEEAQRVSTEETSGPDEEAEEVDEQTALLDAALTHVATTGWSMETLRAGATDRGLSPAAVGMIPRGEAALVLHFEEKCNKQLVEKMTENHEDLMNMGMTSRIRTAVRWRLEMVIPYMKTWPQALSHTAPPQESAPLMLKSRAHLMDDIWFAAGDRATDMSWYSKRAILGAVYTSTELYMITDTSPDFHDTWEFLDRRLEDVITMGKGVGKYGKSAETLAMAFGTTASAFMQEISKKRYPK
mmetsp:Transcript_17894/g.21430  ORF Transcript_17894/g.21430 Transcript_17894/m.21430 type:complete len:360 (+) Transcript_17894:90-1169(+)|eukprot:CAMPEP_0197845978 /NCGR_PEP_ID=MMETSP1438-20131217/2819_1 /TAXON_ID=1461541 /ORGANISM="Pterosperma sp., Strain CCMP1384" /LENGTH=359 /DNA_ID=CAMNT_0043457469 /DNA_START=86 /DNA_END=1165 /DNA_ORIENTATION=+